MTEPTIVYCVFLSFSSFSGESSEWLNSVFFSQGGADAHVKELRQLEDFSDPAKVDIEVEIYEARP